MNHIETCANIFEQHIIGMFKNARRIPGGEMREIPVIGGNFLPYLPETIPPLLLKVAAALCARERFGQDVPSAPPLPLHQAAIEACENAECHRLNLLGYFSHSLAWMDWDYDSHPPFAVYCSGLLAYECAPSELRSDRTLIRTFPPRPLSGLCDEWMIWRSADQITEHRQHGAWTNEMLGRQQDGVPMQAKAEWVAAQLPMYVGCC
jgi:hypothetical protein